MEIYIRAIVTQTEESIVNPLHDVPIIEHYILYEMSINFHYFVDDIHGKDQEYVLSDHIKKEFLTC